MDAILIISLFFPFEIDSENLGFKQIGTGFVFLSAVSLIFVA